MNIPALVTEFLGTFIFLFVVIATANPWAIGATLAALIYLGGGISGGHFNPAVTISRFFDMSFSLNTTGLYIAAQVAAAALAVAAYRQIKK
jgi:aquaporin Z